MEQYADDQQAELLLCGQREDSSQIMGRSFPCSGVCVEESVGNGILVTRGDVDAG